MDLISELLEALFGMWENSCGQRGCVVGVILLPLAALAWWLTTRGVDEWLCITGWCIAAVALWFVVPTRRDEY